MKYKIAFFLPNLESQGGVTVAVQTIANHLESIGHDVHLFPVGKTNAKATNLIHPVNSNKKSEQLMIAKKIFLDEEQQCPFHLVITNSKPTNYIVSQFYNDKKHLIVLHQASMMQKKYFFTYFKQKILYPKIYNNKHIATISKCLLTNFLLTFKYLKPKSTHIIYNAFDPSLIDLKAKEKSELPASEYIISVGRLVKGKNHAMLIKAFKNIEHENIHLVLLGGGNQETYLKNLVKQLNLEKKVHFIGWKENPYPYIKNAKLLVHTSKYETFGRVILEALALDTPVVATDIKCGPNEILVDELSPFLVPLNDIEKLTLKIDEALNEYPKIDQKLLEKFHVRSIARQYLNIIESINKDSRVSSEIN